MGYSACRSGVPVPDHGQRWVGGWGEAAAHSLLRLTGRNLARMGNGAEKEGAVGLWGFLDQGNQEGSWEECRRKTQFRVGHFQGWWVSVMGSLQIQGPGWGSSHVVTW